MLLGGETERPHDLLGAPVEYFREPAPQLQGARDQRNLIVRSPDGKHLRLSTYDNRFQINGYDNAEVLSFKGYPRGECPEDIAQRFPDCTDVAYASDFEKLSFPELENRLR